ncbi:hypothetical protein BN1013_00740 [Candidatus Rubidus massiliensis]|nr:MAG: hypothetical protein BGO10_09780 [Chlamydia sp. 32-24]CDZ80233.1 hypothetical protein BN1013_00740 [Candidatus Rubidus massiliensis]
MNNFIISFLIIPLSFFGWFKDSRSLEERSFDEVAKQALKFVEKKYKLNAMGIGGGMPDGLIHNFNASFEKIGSLSVEQARNLIVSIVNDYLRIINSSEKIKDYLYKYPFTAEELSIAIFIHDKSGTQFEDPLLGTASICAGDISYETFLPPKNKYAFPKRISSKTETFTEAVQILQEQQKSN